MSAESVTSISGRTTSAPAGSVSGGTRPGTVRKRPGPVHLAVKRARREAKPSARDAVFWAVAEKLGAVVDATEGREAVQAADRLHRLLAALGGGEHDPGPGTIPPDDPYGGPPTMGDSTDA